MKITKEYFTKYSPDSQHYNEIFRECSEIDNFIDYFELGEIESCTVLGTATGQVLDYIEEYLEIIPTGCEINEWAHSHTRIKHKVKCVPMQSYVKTMKKTDAIFSNGLPYLKKKEIPPLLKHCFKKCKIMHFDSATIEEHAFDPYRKTLESTQWWKDEFAAAGFLLTKDKGFYLGKLWEGEMLTPQCKTICNIPKGAEVKTERWLKESPTGNVCKKRNRLYALDNVKISEKIKLRS